MSSNAERIPTDAETNPVSNVLTHETGELPNPEETFSGPETTPNVQGASNLDSDEKVEEPENRNEYYESSLFCKDIGSDQMSW